MMQQNPLISKLVLWSTIAMISSFYGKIIGMSSTTELNQKKVLCVGLTCLDIVQTCKEFPVEDSDQR